MRKITKGQRTFIPEVIIEFCDRVLASFPENELALHSKGVAHLIRNEHPQSLGCFERLTGLQPNDGLSLLHYAVCLAKMGEDDRAMEEFARARSISEERCKHILKSIGTLRDPLKALTAKLMQSPSRTAEVEALWYAYFAADVSTN